MTNDKESKMDIEKLSDVKDKALAEQVRRSEGDQCQILLCAGAGCIASGSLELKKELETEIIRQGIKYRATVIETGCLGPCSCGPVLIVGDVFYENVQKEDAEELVRDHLINGRVIERLVSKRARSGEAVPKVDDVSFFRKQTKIVLRNCGQIDPQKIEEYIARDGYSSLAKALDMTQDEVLEQVKISGLRGRGGAGFPTWRKWSFTKGTESDQKYVLCNADEGDPGAFMDRSVLEGDPHSIIEGMAIAAYTVGANQGYVYVRAEYPLAVERLSIALGQAREYGLLGKDIFGKGFDFDLEIRMGSGAFVCGEETALITLSLIHI